MNRFKTSGFASILILFTLAGSVVITVPVLGEWVTLQKRDPAIRDYMSITFTSKNTGWAVGSASFEDLDNPGFIGYTRDGGQTWEKSEIKIETDLTEIYFLDEKHGWAVGAKGTIARTTNGKDWELQISKVGNWLNSVSFVDPDIGYAAGANETILSTRNGGRSWKVLQGGQISEGVGEEDTTLYNAIQFFDEKTGWVAGIRLSPSTQTQSALIQKTTDGGKKWVVQETGKEDVLEDIFFLDANQGWAVGENGVILYTNNGGDTWREQTSGTEEKLRSIQFVDKHVGWAVGGDFGVGVILSTSNGGKKWDVQQINQQIVKVSALDQKNVWLSGADGAIFKLE